MKGGCPVRKTDDDKYTDAKVPPRAKSAVKNTTTVINNNTSNTTHNITEVVSPVIEDVIKPK